MGAVQNGQPEYVQSAATKAPRALPAHLQMRTACIIALMGMLMIFGNGIAHQVMMEYISFEYGLSEAALSLFSYILYLVLGIGQIAVALLTDRYFGVVRAMRAALLLSVIALVAMTLATSNAPPELQYQGKIYQISSIQTTNASNNFILINGQPKGFSISDDGYFNIIQHENYEQLPARLPPGSWEMHMGSAPVGEILLLFPMALLIMARCFGLPLVLSAMATFFGPMHRARTMGLLMVYVCANLGFAMMQIVQIYIEPLLGRRAILGIAILLLLVAYLCARFEPGWRRIQFFHQRTVTARTRNRAYLFIGLGLVLLMILMVSILLKVAPPTAQLLTSPPDYKLVVQNLSYFSLGLWLCLVSLLIYLMRRKQKDSAFYAACALPVLALIPLSFWCVIEPSLRFLSKLSLGYIDWGLFQGASIFLLDIAILNPLTITLLGGLFLIIWPRIHKHFWPWRVLTKIATAFLLVFICYLLLAVGAYFAEGGRMAWIFFVAASLLLPMTELFLLPTVMSATYAMWRSSVPTVALAFLAFTSGFTGIISRQLEQAFGLSLIDPTSIADKNIALMRFGDAFTTLAGMTSLGGACLLLILRPLYLYLLRKHKKAQQAELA